MSRELLIAAGAAGVEVKVEVEDVVWGVEVVEVEVQDVLDWRAKHFEEVDRRGSRSMDNDCLGALPAAIRPSRGGPSRGGGRAAAAGVRGGRAAATGVGGGGELHADHVRRRLLLLEMLAGPAPDEDQQADGDQ